MQANIRKLLLPAAGQITVFTINGSTRPSNIRSTLADHVGVMHKICSQSNHLTFPVYIDFHFFGVSSGRRSADPVMLRHYTRCFVFNHVSWIKVRWVGQ
jgi:hypothetical protein